MHESVLLEEAIQFLNVRAGGVYLDVTGGAGGHAAATLKGIGEKGKLVIADRDPKAVELIKERFGNDNRCFIFSARFSEIFDMLKDQNIPPVDGLLADLGLSSNQLADPERGFGFKTNGSLDMRMDPRLELSAADLVARLREKELADLIFQLGEERHSRRLAREIVKRRKEKAFTTTEDLKDFAEKILGSSYYGQKIHSATRLFQALRIAVNKELEELQFLLDQLPLILAPGGRALIISFHSLEDRLVKRKFQGLKKEGWNLIVKKIVVPTMEEMKRNPRSRSAKLRVIERP